MTLIPPIQPPPTGYGIQPMEDNWLDVPGRGGVGVREPGMVGIGGMYRQEVSIYTL